MPEVNQKSSSQQKVRLFYERMRSFIGHSPQLIIRFNQVIDNLECMTADNLEDGLPQQLPLELQPKRRAYEFLCALATYLDIDTELLRKYLFLKHTMTSQMGTHFIFGLRWRNLEIEENGFFVHLDHNNNIVMVTATYQPLSELTATPEPWANGELEEKLCAVIDKLRNENADNGAWDEQTFVHKIMREGWVWTPNWDNSGQYELRYKVKLITAQNSYVVLLSRTHEADLFVVDAHDRPEMFQLGHVLDSSWDNVHGHPKLPSGQPTLSKILLRNVTRDDGLLVGPYAAIEDRLTMSWPTELLPKAEESDTQLDRLMAYYHIDKMQRYFRQLGLDVLDEYDHLNPLQVVLSTMERTAYVSAEKRIYFSQISQHPDESWTHARNTRTVYHECVHAITDAIARLHRQDKTTQAKTTLGNLRKRQLLQAAAMDEGLADYFACSMVAQTGDSLAEYRRLEQDENGHIRWNMEENTRRPLELGPLDLSIPESTEEFDIHSIYIWSQHWARYLWLLRRQLGAEVADVLIANSLFFLTRWASFGQGILALVTADRLLFGRENQQIIFDTAKVKEEDVAEFYTEGGAQRLQSTSRTIPGGESLTNIHQDLGLAMLDFGMSGVLDSEEIETHQPQSLYIGQLWSAEEETGELVIKPL